MSPVPGTARPRSAARSRRRASVVFAISCAMCTAGASPLIAATKTTKATKSTKAGTPAKPSTGKQTVTAGSGTLAPRKAGEPVKTFGSIDASEWPVAGDAVIASVISRSIDVLRAPGDRTLALQFNAGSSVDGGLHFLALGSQGDWVRVAIPVRPNGTVGWVKASEVRLQPTKFRIAIELKTNTLRLYDGPNLVVETSVGAGTGGTPTPKGLFFVKERVPQANPNGALGPVALGLSGFSEVLYSFAGGSGTIAIHGTNAPGRLGGDVSHGCVRVANAVITKLAATVPLGTPVEIAERFSDLPSTRRASSWTTQSPVASPAAGATGAVGATPIVASPITAVVDAATTTTVAAAGQ